MIASAASPPSPPPGWPGPESPFHPGELAIQARLGVAEKMDQQGRRGVRDQMPDQHRDFYAQLPFLLVGATDRDGQPWATILTGQPGFLASPDSRTLVIGAVPKRGDPLARLLEPGTELGLLGIEPPTRRRNRLNGRLVETGPTHMTLAVAQSFGNCPQYIQARAPRFVADPQAEPPLPAETRSHLSAADRELISRADTFFIATASGRQEAGRSRGADVSHRGGKPGFVRADPDGTLSIPDFVGNFHFNTMGNLALDPRAGLLFVDWESGDLLHLAGEAEVIWDGPEVRAFAGAERLIVVRPRAVVRRPAALPLRFEAPAASPFLVRTGDWDAASRALQAERSRSTWRPFRVASVTDESRTIRSFRLEPADGGGVAAHAPGQHLPIRIALPGVAEPARRTYTISDASDGRSYRLSVKREGAVSTFLHDHALAGSTIEALAPRGSFVFDSESRRPAVLVSAGIGITPMIAMLNSLLVNEGRTRHHAPIWFIHGARDGSEHAFADHVRTMAKRHPNLHVHVVYSRPRPEDRLGESHEAVGRLDADALAGLLPFAEYDAYLCGPGGFMQALYDGLIARGLPDARIQLEAFGPSTVRRSRPSRPATPKVALAEDEAVEVLFATSGLRAMWRPADGALLDLAEAQGLAPAYSCRAGLCGTCAVRVLKGGVEYDEEPAAGHGADEALICQATPRPGPHIEDSLDREGVTLEL